MRKASVRLCGMLALGLLLGGGTARAEFMNWSYHWSINPTPVFSSGTGTVAMALGQGGRGATNLLAAAVTTSSSASAHAPDHFDRSFSLTLHLTDRATHKSGALTFHGTLIGTLTSTSAHLIETFRVPKEHITLSGHTYYVTLPSRLALLSPGASVIPLLLARVQVYNVPPPPHPHVTAAALMTVHTASIQSASAPEPSALVLTALGIALLASARVGRYRRPRVAPV